MNLAQCWLATIMVVIGIQDSNELSSDDINYSYHGLFHKLPDSIDNRGYRQENPIIRHHHRHRHKDEENNGITNYKNNVANFVEPNLVSYDVLNPGSDGYMTTGDWRNMSNDQIQIPEKMLKYHHPHWPIKREAVIEGDLVLGGLMMVHERSDNMTCGPVMPQGGIQALETMLYTLDYINNKLKLISGVTLGAHVLDDCDKDTYGLEMAVDFIKG